MGDEFGIVCDGVEPIVQRVVGAKRSPAVGVN